MKRGNRRAFAIKQWPVFGRGPYSDALAPATVRSSPYFWWFRFLQLNAEYDAALRGKRSNLDRFVVRAFGPVRTTDFKTWWNSHVDLFAEPPTRYWMGIAEHHSDLAPIGAADAVNVVVPLEWNSKSLKQAFGRIVNNLVKQGKVRPAQKGFVQGDAQFKIGRKWSSSAMELAYRVYTTKMHAVERGERLAWADVAIRAKLPMARGLRERDINHKLRDQRRLLTILAMRHNYRALKLIAASTTRHFPAANEHADQT